MILFWFIVLVFQSTKLYCSNDENRNTVVSFIQTLQQKYCWKNSCNATAKDIEVPSRIPFGFGVEQCPPCYACSCRDDCKVFGDCCPGLHIGPSHFKFKCLDIPYKKDMVRYLIATDCSPNSQNYSEELAEKCNNILLDPLGSMLVTARVKSPRVEANVTFWNRYCAECNGVTNYMPWRILVECPGTPDQRDITNAKEFLAWATQFCWIGYIPPKQFIYQIRQCTVLDEELHSTCNETGLWEVHNETVEQACSIYYNPLAVGKYKNIFCFLCNGHPEEVLQHPVQCDSGSVNWGIQPFSAILNFDTLTEFENGIRRCKEDEYDDTISNKCRKIHCPTLQKIKGGNCTLLFDSAHGIAFKLKFVLIPSETLLLSTVQSDRSIKDVIVQRINEGPHLATVSVAVVPYFYSHMEQLSSVSLVSRPDTTPTIPPYTGKNTTTKRNSDSLVPYVMIEAIATQWIQSAVSEVMEHLLSLQYKKIEIKTDSKPLIFNSIPSIYFSTGAYNISMRKESLNSSKTDSFIDDSSRMALRPALVEIPSPHLDCPQVEFKRDEYKQASNGSIFIIPDSLYVHANQFELTNSTNLRVCINFLQEQANITNTTSNKNNNRYTINSSSLSDETMTFLTMVCLGVSLVCLLLCFITHCLFAEMRTLPGFNLMFLTAALFVSQTLYLFGAGATDNAMVCKIMGILIHYFWLVTFAWMDVCSFHVFRVFRNVFSTMSFNDNKKLVVLKYALFSFIMPAAIVALNILVNYFALGDISMGYNDDMNICFISPGLVSILSFGIPAGLTVILSAGFFVYTCIALYRTSKERRMVGKQQSVQVFRFFKLASITGLSWLFGFLGAILKVKVLVYLFIVLAGGQGLLVFLSFSFPGTVCSKYASCLGCARKKNEQKTLSLVTSVSNVTHQTKL